MTDMTPERLAEIKEADELYATARMAIDARTHPRPRALLRRSLEEKRDLCTALEQAWARIEELEKERDYWKGIAEGVADVLNARDAVPDEPRMENLAQDVAELCSDLTRAVRGRLPNA